MSSTPSVVKLPSAGAWPHTVLALGRRPAPGLRFLLCVAPGLYIVGRHARRASRPPRRAWTASCTGDDGRPGPIKKENQYASKRSRPLWTKTQRTLAPPAPLALSPAAAHAGTRNMLAVADIVVGRRRRLFVERREPTAHCVLLCCAAEQWQATTPTPCRSTGRVPTPSRCQLMAGVFFISG